MKKLLEKLNYKEQNRIAIINAEDMFIKSIKDDISNLTIDKEIDPRFPYDFIILFVKNISEIDYLAPLAVHNLMADGVLWFCFPRKDSFNYTTNIDREHGWKTLNDSGLRCVRTITIDDDWSALRFRNEKFIKSSKT
jgi:hypothetical protein